MAKPPSKRELTIAHLRIAGYDDDRKAWMRLYVENRISLPIAEKAWRDGRAMKAAGMPRAGQS